LFDDVEDRNFFPAPRTHKIIELAPQQEKKSPQSKPQHGNARLDLMPFTAASVLSQFFHFL
jgi:hypothetical protein